MPTITEIGPTRTTGRTERIRHVLTGWTRHLPGPLRRLLPPELIGFLILGGFTFGLDLALLWVLRATTDWPVPVTVSAAYVCAVALNYVLNRTLNFRSHAPVAGEATRYLAAIVADYLVTVGVTTALAAAGAELWLARGCAAACAALFLWVATRWFVFRRRGHPRPAAGSRGR